METKLIKTEKTENDVTFTVEIKVPVLDIKDDTLMNETEGAEISEDLILNIIKQGIVAKKTIMIEKLNEKPTEIAKEVK